MSNNLITIGYLPTAGRPYPAKYLLEISGVQYQDVRYTNLDDWFLRDKQNLGLPFPNLPYIIDGDVKITESETIFDYLIERLNKTELLGKGNDKYIVSNIRNLFSDLASRLGQYYVAKNEEDKIYVLNEHILPKLKYIYEFLGNKEYLLGYFTAADIYFLTYINIIKKKLPEIFSQFAERFNPVLTKIQQIPQIAACISNGCHP